MRIIVMFRRLAVLAGAVALVAPLLAGCGALTGAQGSSRPTVVASFYPLAYVSRRIVGDHMAVVDLTHPGMEPHDLEMTVRQTADLADANVVVYERGFQAAVDDAVDQSSHDHVVNASVSGQVRGDDPHFWLDPTRLSRVAGAVEQQVAAADPAHRRDYQRNLASLQRDLAAVDAAYRHGLARCRIDTIVSSHDAFGYMGRRYGFHVVGINGLSPDAEPSPAHIRQLHDLIKHDGITTVFSERLASQKLAGSLAADLGLRTAVLDPIEGLSNATANQDYLSLMRRNLAALRKADQCQ
jgi:zinc transport system substrate-binding protein